MQLTIQKLICYSIVTVALMGASIFAENSKSALEIVTSSSSTREEYFRAPQEVVYPIFEDGLPYESWTLKGRKDHFLFSAKGGKSPYRWRVQSGNLPEGLQLSEEGKLSGLATKEGTFKAAVEVTDAGGQKVAKAISLTVYPYRGKWFREAKFGFFIQMGTASNIPLVTSADKIKDWEKTFTRFDAEKWAEEIYRRGGRVLNLIGRGGDGVRLWPSTTPSQSPLFTARDYLGEIIKACHKRDIKVISYFANLVQWNPNLHDGALSDGTWNTLNYGIIDELTQKGVDGIWIDMGANPEIPTVDPAWFVWDQMIPLMRTRNPWMTIQNNPSVADRRKVVRYPYVDIVTYEPYESFSDESLVVGNTAISRKKMSVEVIHMLVKSWGWNPDGRESKDLYFKLKSADKIIKAIHQNWVQGITSTFNFPVSAEGDFIMPEYQKTIDQVTDWVVKNRESSASPEISLDPSKVYPASQKVELKAKEGAEIRYTLDGSIPLEEGVLYEKLLLIEKSTRVNAIAREKGKGWSLLLSQNILIQPKEGSGVSMLQEKPTLKTAKTKEDGSLGMEVSFRNGPLALESVGRYTTKDSANRLIQVVRKSDNFLIYSSESTASDFRHANGFTYRRIPRVILEPGITYQILSRENRGDEVSLFLPKQLKLQEFVRSIKPAYSDASDTIIKKGTRDDQGQYLDLQFEKIPETKSSNLALYALAEMVDESGNALVPNRGIYLGDYATDGNDKTFAQPGGSWNWTLAVELGKVEANLKRIKIHFVNDETLNQKLYPTDYKIEVSEDRKNWTTVIEVPDNHELQREHAVDPFSGRYFRVVALKPNEINQEGVQMAVQSFEVYRD